MAVGTTTRFSEGMGADQYDAVTEKLGLADEPPEGLIFHSAGELEGRFQVFNDAGAGTFAAASRENRPDRS